MTILRTCRGSCTICLQLPKTHKRDDDRLCVFIESVNKPALGIAQMSIGGLQETRHHLVRTTFSIHFAAFRYHTLPTELIGIISHAST